MVSVRPIKPLPTSSARLLNFFGWFLLLIAVSSLMFLLSFNGGAVFSAVSIVILTYLIVRRNILAIHVDPVKSSLVVQHLPWFGKPRETAYPINSQTEVSYIPAILKIPVLGMRPTGRNKLVVITPTWYELEFFSSDFSDPDLRALQDGINAAKH